MSKYTMLDELIIRYSVLKECYTDIEDAFELIKESYDKKGKLLVAGNGGSAADADHIVGELLKGFKSNRPISSELKRNLISIDDKMGLMLAENLQCGLPAISLTSQVSLLTASINDIGKSVEIAQALMGLGKEEDVLFAITTSGNSMNIVNAAFTAKALGMKIIALTGKQGGEISKIANCTIKVPEEETFKVQELHLPVYHCLCSMLEEHYFEKNEHR